jgi:hypothetical protein
MSFPLTAHDVFKQPRLTSICGMSDVMKLSVTRSITCMASACSASRARAAAACARAAACAVRRCWPPRAALKIQKVPPEFKCGPITFHSILARRTRV